MSDTTNSNQEAPLEAWTKPKRKHLKLIAALSFFAGLFWFIPPVYKLIWGSTITVTRYEKKKGETRADAGPATKDWVQIKKVSKHALHAIVAAEDGKFYQHSGFDFAAIQKSIEVNRKKNRYARGASTLSQQVVKMAFLGREKTLLRKAREASGTVIMEIVLPKERILEWYVNLAEFGDGVYGIERGAWHYFKTKPELLTIEQSVNLALVLPSPNGWSKGLRNRHLTPFGHRRFAAILKAMYGNGFITKSQWLTALSRGDFGRPIHGYAAIAKTIEKDDVTCSSADNCEEESSGVDATEEDDENDSKIMDDTASSTIEFPPKVESAPLPNTTLAPEVSGTAESPPLPQPAAPSPPEEPSSTEDLDADQP